MPLELQVIRAGEFVCLDADEHLDFEASKRALEGLAQACQKRGLDRAMLDLRGLPVLPRPHFSAAELAALVGTFRDAGFTRQQRLAVVYDHDVHSIVRNFAFFGKMRGLQVQAFNQFEKAIYWLSQENPDERDAGESIPIDKREAKKRPSDVTLGIPHPHVHRTVHRTIKGHSR